LGIPEYWIVDPLENRVTIFTLVEGLYESDVFTGANPIRSQTFPELRLTAAQILGEPSGIEGL
jgi:Uma2 family endonuclease